MSETDFEKMGVFYLGRRFDPLAGKVTGELVLYDSKDLLTHAVCIGMTGSGKTGLCLGLMEEAAIDGIPIIAIDPKGDIANLLLTFPQLQGQDFEPWVDASQARRAGLSIADFACQQAQTWRQGLSEWGQTAERIAKLKQSAEFAIYTPGSSAGLSVSIVRSFGMPPQAVLDDADAFAERVASATSSLLSLLGVDADPLHSREHILIANILQSAWRQGQDLTLPDLILLIQKPPMLQVGALAVDTFYPAKERFELAMLLNNLLASPGFDAWLQGEPLDIDRLLYTKDGKPRVVIFSTAHLDDAQKMFFTTLLLNQLLAWMRSQSGTTSLRAVFYMDEIFGYFPPTASPPCKRPLLMLMKQARAFGLGIVLATQNPVDIDYKGLSNAGTWFIGRLQTERDKLRVLDGLQGASGESGSGFDRAGIDKLLSQLGSRVFLMNNVHDAKPSLLQTRFTLSYLRGPLSRDQIKLLMKSQLSLKSAAQLKSAGAQAAVGDVSPAATVAQSGQVESRQEGMRAALRPLIPPGISEHFLPLRRMAPPGAQIVYRPMVVAVANVRFVDVKAGVDSTLQYTLLTSPPEEGMLSLNFDAAVKAQVFIEQLQEKGQEGAGFMPLPGALADPKIYSAWTKQFGTWIYNSKQLKLLKSEVTSEYCRPRESERDFRIRLTQSAREKRDEAAAALKKKYAPKLAALENSLARAQLALEKEQLQAADQKVQSAISVGATVLGAFMGQRGIGAGTIARASSAARSVGRASREQHDAMHAQQTVDSLRDQLTGLNAEFAQEMANLEGKFDPLQTALKEVVVAAKKTNITVPLLGLVWAPYIEKTGNESMPAWIASAT